MADETGDHSYYHERVVRPSGEIQDSTHVRDALLKTLHNSDHT